MLLMNSATIGYRKNDILVDATLSLKGHEIIALIAPNGKGKTTLLKAIAGDTSLMKNGSVSADHVQVFDTKQYREKVFYSTSDDTLLYPNLTARQHLQMVKSLWCSQREFEPICTELSAEWFLDVRVKHMSQGMKQQLSLAMAVLSNARYLLLDEPMNALDPFRVDQATQLLRSEAAEGRGILVSSHILSNIDELCESCIVFQDNKLQKIPLNHDSKSLFMKYYDN